MKIVVLERGSVGADVSVCLDDLGETTYYWNTKREEVPERVRDAEIIVANKAPLCAETLEGAKGVRLISEFATGYDNIDLAYCKARGIRVTNIGNYCTAAVAQHTFAMALYLEEKLPYYDRYVKSGAYAKSDRFCHFDVPFEELDGQTWGIIGMGHIGRRVARIAEAFGCRVCFTSLTGNSTVTNYERVKFPQLLQQSDILSLHCPLSEKSYHLIDAQALSLMKQTAILLNVARGAVVDTRALCEALQSGTIAAAGLDVLEREPIAKDDPLGEISDSQKLLITPHLAWASISARRRLATEVRENIRAFLNGEERNVIA